MMLAKTSTLFTTLACAAVAAAHGYVGSVVVNDKAYEGYTVFKYAGTSDGPNVFGWTTTAKDQGPVSYQNMSDPDIICHRGATPAKSHVQVAAGDVLNMRWNFWAHPGAVVDYLANCNGPCETVDKESLEFFKIDGAGLITQGKPGFYASQVLASNGYSWSLKIPSNIAPGNYVLRHEIVALQVIGEPQFYPQCFNLEITGSGSDEPAGVKGRELYTRTEPGLEYNIWNPTGDYVMPGPSLAPGLVSTIQQTGKSNVTNSASATPGPLGPASGSPSGSNTPATTTDSPSSPQSTNGIASSTSQASQNYQYQPSQPAQSAQPAEKFQPKGGAPSTLATSVKPAHTGSCRVARAARRAAARN